MEYWSQIQPVSTGFRKHLRRTLWAALAAFGAVLYWLQYSPALRGWFLREDSRYLSNGLFSLQDVLEAFLTPHNAMGHYRPITKLIWGVPQWLGAGDARVYHALLFAGLAISGIFLMRLSFRLYGSATIAVATGTIWALMPVNAKPLYWISAGQDVTAALFVLAALTFRMEQWLQPRSRVPYRLLALVSLFFALTSREVGFSGAVLLFLVDAKHGKLRQSGDVAAILGAFVLLVFVLHPPFERARVHVSLTGMFSSQALSDFGGFLFSTPWTHGDAMQAEYPPLCRLLSLLAFACAAVGALFHWSLLFALLLALAGVVPFLLIHALSVEYAFLFGAGLALALGGVPALLLRMRLAYLRPQLAVAATSAFCMYAYQGYLVPSRALYEKNYTDHSLVLRSFLGDLAAFSRTLPPFRPVELTDVGTFNDSEVRETLHFIPPALGTLIGERTFLISPGVLKTGEGTETHDPAAELWTKSLTGIQDRVRIHYGNKGFALD